MTLMNWIKTSGLTLLFVLTCGTSHPAAARAEVGSENPQASSQEDILAQVNGENVTSEDLELVLAEMHSGMQDTQRSAFDLDRLLFRLVNDALLAQEARASTCTSKNRLRAGSPVFRRSRWLGSWCEER